VNFVSLDFRLVWRLWPLQWQETRRLHECSSFPPHACWFAGLLFFSSSLQLDYVVAFLFKINPSQPEVLKKYFSILFSGFRLPLSLSLSLPPALDQFPISFLL
jgi:hypothetical protein